ncbi:hypothetical protein K523DRAFT_232963 [Schizophyllum commune Tattone D]|nr:hypothetical protein K523DRAFT_232963 [Schizophyllum commune Tattone D]
MLNVVNGGAYPPDAISRGRAGSTVAQLGSAYFQDGFGSSYGAARGIAEPQGPSAGEGRRRDRSKLPSGGAAPSYWSNPSSFGWAGNPAARDAVQPGSRLDGPTAEPAPLYSTIANALTPVSPDHVYAQPRSLYPKTEVASPTLSYSTPLPPAGAPDESQAQRYPIGQPSASTGPRSAIESVATTASPPPASPQDKKGPSGRPQKMHQCPVCQKWFPRPGGLQTHMNSHNNVKPYICGFHECNLRFTVQSNARRHRRNAHGNEFAQQYEEAERRQPPKQPNITFDDPVVNSQIFLEAPRQLMWLPPNELEEEMTGIVS